MLTLEDKKNLMKRCLAFINECPKDIKANQSFWDKEVDYLITQFFLHLKEGIDDEKTISARETKKIPREDN